MVATLYCRLMAALVAAFIFSSSDSLWAQGFPGGHRDALGPRFRAAPGGSKIPGRQDGDIDSVRHWRRSYTAHGR